MNSWFRIIVGVLFFSLNAEYTFSQKAKEDILKINKAYIGKKITMKLNYNLYRNHVTKTVFQNETAEVKQSGDLNWTRIGPIETVTNETYSLIVNNKEKSITMLGKEMNSKKKTDPLGMNLDSLLKRCQKVEFKKVNEHQNSYEFVFPFSEYSKVVIVYNNKTFFIEKMLLFYQEKKKFDESGKEEAPRMEITCTEIKTNSRFTANDFTYDNYIEKNKNNKWLCKPAYKGYSVQVQVLNE